MPATFPTLHGLMVRSSDLTGSCVMYLAVVTALCGRQRDFCNVGIPVQGSVTTKHSLTSCCEVLSSLHLAASWPTRPAHLGLLSVKLWLLQHCGDFEERY